MPRIKMTEEELNQSKKESNKKYNDKYKTKQYTKANRKYKCEICGKKTSNRKRCHKCWERSNTPTECCGYEIDGTHLDTFDHFDPYRFIMMRVKYNEEIIREMNPNNSIKLGLNEKWLNLFKAKLRKGLL
jgi:hypothetical protein